MHSCQATAMPTINKFLISMILFCIVSSLCIINVDAQKSNYLYYPNENNINVKNNDIGKIHFKTFIHKDSLHRTNLESEYLSSYSNNQIPIAEFRPAILDFKEQSTTVPAREKVVIYNKGKENLVLESISGSTSYYYCSFFSDKIIPPGGNTSFDVFFLPREIGLAKSAIYINTNKGVIKYNVQGYGINNNYQLKPVIKAKILLKNSFLAHIRLHNPHNATMEILEIFSSDDDLHIELINDSMEKNIKNTKYKAKELIKMKKQILKKNIETESDEESCESIPKNWRLKPFETQTVGQFRYISRQVSNHTSFVCVLARLKNTVDQKIQIIIPIELEVTDKSGIYLETENINFGNVLVPESNQKNSNDFKNKFSDISLKNHFHFTEPTNRFDRNFDLWLINNEEIPLKITDIYPVRHNPALTIIKNKNVELTPDRNFKTKVAELKFNPLKSKRQSDNYGKIHIKTNNRNVSLTIDFYVNLETNGLEYNKENVMFDFLEDVSEFREFKLINKHSFPVIVHSVTFGNDFTEFNFELDFNGPILLPDSGQTNENNSSLFKILFNDYLKKLHHYDLNNNHVYDRSIASKLFMKTMCTVHTNYTDLEIPFYIYDSKLETVIQDDDGIEIDDLILNPIKINATRKFRIEIYNYNPFDINFESLEVISKDLKEKKLKSITNKLTIQFDHFKPLRPDTYYNRIYINKTLTNNDIKNKLKIPAHYAIVVILTIQNTHNPKISDDVIYQNDSILFEYELSIKTKYEVNKLNIEFLVVKDILELIKPDANGKSSILENSKTNSIAIRTFPNKISSRQFTIRNKLTNGIYVDSIEFSHFGDAFGFKWLNDSNGRYGFIQAKSNALLGEIEVNANYLCTPNCYLGIEPRSHASIIDRSSLYINNLEDIEKTTDNSLIYDLWLKTFNLKYVSSVKNKFNESVQTFDVDYFLFSLMRDYWAEMSGTDTFYYSKIEIFLNKNETNDKVISYRFPIVVEFIWPRLVTEPTHSIDFALTQIYSTTRTKNLTITNPSNSNVLFQIVLASNYCNVQKILQLVDENSHLFFDSQHESTTKQLLNRNTQNGTETYFILKTDQSINPDIIEQFEYLNIEPDIKNSLIIIVEPNKEINIEIEFLPVRVGKHEDMLIIRNNLTILDVQLISGEVGSAELRINNLPPMKSSIFYNEIPQNSPGHQTIDYSNLILQMNDKDFEHCKSADSLKIESNGYDYEKERLNGRYTSFLEEYSHIILNVYNETSRMLSINNQKITTDGIDFTFMSEELSNCNDLNCKSSFRTKDGIVLRAFLELENIGTTDLNVFNVIFDGDSCFSRGIEVTYCNPFTIPPQRPEAPLNESVFLLEIRYRPDFTMSFIKKSLILETNIGDLRYGIELHIPNYMLSTCHDSLPRPPLEGYLFYLGIFLVLLLVLVMLLTSIVESRSIIKYQNGIYRQIYALNSTKSWFDGPKSFEQEFNNVKNKPSEQLAKQAPKSSTTSKSKNKNFDKKSKNGNHALSKALKQNGEQTNHNHRVLTKALSSPRASNRIHLSSDSSVSSCSSLSTNINKKTGNQSPKSSPRSEKPQNKEKNEIFELPKSEFALKTDAPQLTLPEVTVTEPDNTHFKVKISKTKPNSRPRTPNEIVPLPQTFSPTGSKRQNKTAASNHNEIVLVNRKKSQLTASKSTPNESFQKPRQVQGFKALQIPETEATRLNQQVAQNYTKPQNSKTISNLSKVLTTGDLLQNSENPSLFSSNKALNKLDTQDQLEKLEIELLNSQLQQLQQQNKKQFQDISYLSSSSFLMNSKFGSNESSSSPSPSSSNSSSVSSAQEHNTQMKPFPSQNRTIISHLQTQYDLLDMMLNSNKNEPDNLEKSNSPLLYGLIDNVNNDGLTQDIVTNEKSHETIHSMKVYYDEISTVAEISDHPPGFGQNHGENCNALNNPSMTDSWIMIDSTNIDDDYDRIVNETEIFKKTFFDLDKASNVSPHSPPVDLSRNEDLDKLLCSLINTGSQNKEKLPYFPGSNKQPLHSSVSSEEYYKGSYLGPIQRPKAFQSNNSLIDFNHDLNMNSTNLKENGQIGFGSNFKLTGEDIAMLSALFANKNQEMSSNKNKSHKQPLLKAKSTGYHDYRLFGNNSHANSETKSSLLLENNFGTMGTSSPSYWPEPSTDQKPSVASSSNAQPWNSVLLNDFDNYAAPASLNNSSTGNHIKNLWSTSLKESPLTNSSGTTSKKGHEKLKKYKDEKKTL